MPTIEKLPSSKKKATAAAVMAAVSLFGASKSARAEATPKTPVPILIQNFEKAKEYQPNNKANINRLASVIAKLAGVRKEIVLGKKLKSIESLPGYGKQVSPEHQKELQESSVHILYREKNKEDDAWKDLCSATKISLGGKTGVLTAKHCLSEGVFDGVPALGRGPQNFIDATKYDYAFAKPEITDGRARVPLELATGLSLAEQSDYALFSFDQSPYDQSRGVKTWDLIPSINLDNLIEEPQPGEEVSLYGYPAYNNFVPSAGKGIYLATVKYSDKYIPKNLAYYLVGIEPAGPAGDNCNYGDSGLAVRFASGGISGPLARRQNVGYKTNVPNGDEEPNPLYKYKIMQQTGIDTSKFTTFCWLAREDYPTVDGNLAVNNLFEGLNNHAVVEGTLPVLDQK